MATATFLTWLLMNGSAFLDYRQTIFIARHPERFHEINPVLGEHPSVGKVNAAFAVGAVVKNVIFFSLPDKYRVPFGLGYAAISAGLVVHNNTVGIEVNF